MNPSPEKPLDLYSRRAGWLRDAYYAAHRRKHWYTAALTAAAVIAGVGFIEYRRHGVTWGLAPLGGALLAGFASRGLRRAAAKARTLYRLRGYYDRGIARLNRDWDSLPTGEEYVEPGHAYSSGLDLFGRGSLYQLLCSARTRAGKDTLARWMKEPASIEEARARNAAVRELWTCGDLREAIAAAGAAATADFRTESFREWVGSAPAGFPAWAPVLAFPLAVTMAAMLLWSWLGNAPQLLASCYFAAVLGLEAGFSFLFLKRVRATLEWLRLPAVELPVLREVVSILEQRRFKAPKLVELSERLKLGRSSASRELGRLMRLVFLLELRDQLIVTLLSYVLLWGSQFAMAIDRWRVKHGARMLEWVAAVGEFEALISIATYACEHPQDPFPEFVAEGPMVEAVGMGHPLLDEAKCVRNDLKLDASQRFLVISGSNMSGKSTLLRAVGLNAVLARIGAPVRCHRLRLSDLRVGASILVRDSLAEGRSHFMAELERLRQTIDEAGWGPLLFVIDEILIGTNSHDRRIAAEWVVRALIVRGGVGLISTHDLALTSIATADGLCGGNFHFADTGDASGLSFDYLLKPGVVERSNALNIVRHLGIDTGELPARGHAAD